MVKFESEKSIVFSFKESELGFMDDIVMILRRIWEQLEGYINLGRQVSQEYQEVLANRTPVQLLLLLNIDYFKEFLSNFYSKILKQNWLKENILECQLTTSNIFNFNRFVNIFKINYNLKGFLSLTFERGSGNTIQIKSLEAEYLGLQNNQLAPSQQNQVLKNCFLMFGE